MASAQAIAFLALGGALALLAALALVRIGLLRLESPLGIVRDGLPGGAPAPRWRLPDTDGGVQQVPSGAEWQLLLFSDHSLREFPELGAAVTALREREPGLEAVVLPSKNAELAAETARAIGLDVPVVPVDRDFYWHHNVRVMPFLILLDREGVVLAEGLADNDSRLEMIWHRGMAEARARQTRGVAGRPAGAAG